MYPLSSFTLRELAVHSPLAYARRPAAGWVGSDSHSYARFGLLCARFADQLRASGLKAGDRVVLLAENRPEWGIAYLAITATGMVVVPVLSEFSAEQIANIVKHADSAAVVVSDKLKQKLPKSCPRVIRLEDIPALATEDPTLPALAVQLEACFPPVQEDSLAAIIYTSGTTGNSKGVMLSHKNLVWDAWATRSIIRLRRNDRLLSVLPLAHTYECTIGFIAPFLQGCSMKYLDRAPTASVLLPALKAVRPTVMCTVPLIIEKTFRMSVRPALEAISLYRRGKARKLLHWVAGRKLYATFGGRLRFFGVGGAALAPDVEQFLLDARFPYAIGYGLTETAPLIAGCAPGKTCLGSTGPAMRGVDLRIAEPHPDTGDGEIQARGPNVMQGYYKDPERSAEAMTEDGWFRTGDLGHFDAKGRLFIRGRLKTMILGAAGENIYPEEIESMINAHELVAESLVYGDGRGLSALVHLKPEVLERLEAAVQDRIDDAGELIENIRREINARLSGFSKLSKIQLQKTPFEKTPSQKIKRFLYPHHKGDHHGHAQDASPDQGGSPVGAPPGEPTP